ncbi:MAG: LCP family protein, partial [Acidimicrobiia bacterium]
MALIKYVVFHPLKATTVLLVGVLLGLGAFYAYQVNTALGYVATEEFNPVSARQAIFVAPEVQTPVPTIPVETLDRGFDINAGPLQLILDQFGRTPSPADIFPTTIGTPIGDEVFDSYLLIGTDASGFLADTIILALQPSEGGDPIMVSLPRDLWVWNICKQRFTRLNEGLGGCQDSASGAELMAIMVEDYTGIPIDHLARINFDGFARLVNVMGGISVCVKYPTRDANSGLDIPSGCQTANGDTALAWVRSRHTQQLKGEVWVQVVGSDFARQKRQQDVLFQLAAKAGRFSSPTSLVNKLSAVASSIRVDSSW